MQEEDLCIQEDDLMIRFVHKGDFGKRKVENVKEDLNNMFGNGLTLNDSVSHK